MLGKRVKQEPEETELEGKHNEVSEHIEFDVDRFLASIPKPPPKRRYSLYPEPEANLQCPRCLVDMKFGVSVRDDGRVPVLSLSRYPL